MSTITKRELIDRIAVTTKEKRAVVKLIVQAFLDEVINEVGRGNRLEFRDFGVFETKKRKPRRAQNPKTLVPVSVPSKRTVKFKVGRVMKEKLAVLDHQDAVKASQSPSGSHAHNPPGPNASPSSTT